MNNVKKVVLISGASSGLGLSTTKHLYEKGFVVYAGARSYKTESTEQSSNGNQGILHKVYLDVTDQQSIESLIQEIVRKEGRLDVLVNCAAIIVLGSVEDITMGEFQGVMDTNLYGTIRMCRSVLPVMRENKKGLIINFSSGAGLVGLPFSSAYCSSKFAIEGFSEVLRWETKSLGIDVVIVEPGDSKSASAMYRLHTEKADSDRSVYKANFRTVTEKFASDEANGADPKMAAEKVYKIIMKSKPGIRYNVFRLVEKMLVLKMILPSSLVESIFYGYYNLKKDGTQKSK